MTPVLMGVGVLGLLIMAFATRRWGALGALAVYGGGVLVAGCLWPFFVIAGHLAGADIGRMAELRAAAPAVAASVGGAWAVGALPVLVICAAWALTARPRSR